MNGEMKMSDLDQKIKDAKNKYQKEWRNKNKEKQRQYMKNYWGKRVEKDIKEQEAKNV
jgi:membrane protein insertase Oxa1/YidC/SpoIIIJ